MLSVRFVRCAAVVLAVTAVATSAYAQVGRPTFVLEPASATGRPNHLGVAALGGEIFVAARGGNDPSGARLPHALFVFDGAGNLIRTVEQSPIANASRWGWRDGASDGAGALMFGSEEGIEVIDANGAPASTVLATNGPGAVSSPIRISGSVLRVHRGLAFDPDGDNGRGSFFVGDFAEAVFEIDLLGHVIGRFSNDFDWSVYGLAIAPGGRLWVSAVPNRGRIVEFDVDRSAQRLVPTGRSISRGEGEAPHGGIDLVDALDGRGCGSDLIAIDQAEPDLIRGYRVELWDGYETSPSLAIAVNGGQLERGGRVEIQRGVTQTLDLQSDLTGVLYVNVGDPASVVTRTPGPIGPYRSVWEFALLTSFTTPSTQEVLVPILGQSVVSLPVAGILRAPIGTHINAQMLAIDARVPVAACGLQLPIGASDVVGMEFVTPYSVEIRADGVDTANRDANRGFFSIRNASASDPIAEIVLDWTGIIDIRQARAYLDTRQPGLADTFEGGNSTTPGCLGTYRNGSDIATGLVYDGLNTQPANPCDPNSNTGWMGLNPALNGATGGWRTLRFRFTSFGPGQVFEFDCDIDGAIGRSGGDMDGMPVRVRMQSGLLLSGWLQREDAETASVRL